MKIRIKKWLGTDKLEETALAHHKALMRMTENIREIRERLGILKQKSDKASKRYDEHQREQKALRKGGSFFIDRSGRA